MRVLTRILAVLAAALSFPATAQEDVGLSRGQTLYLPVYSHVYHGDPDKRGKPAETLVSVHISIRNTDPRSPITLTSARYYDTQGRPVREFLASPQTIPAMGTHELFVPRTDVSGGSGANFLIIWNAETAVNPPLVEALHADIREARTLLFITTARPLKPR